MSERSCSLAKFCWSAAITPVLGAPTVAGASVAAEVLQHKRGPKVIAFKKRRRKNSQRKRGYRDEITVLRITEILADGKTADGRAAAEEGKAGAATPAEGDDEAPKAAKKKAPRQEAAAKKAAAKAARQDGGQKAPAKKTAARRATK